MPVRSAAIIDVLPDLRRYAGALLRDQARADALVERCLEQLLAEQALLGDDRLRLVVFALFDRLYEAERPDAAATASFTGDAAAGIEQALERLPIDERKALLLTGLAGFSQAEAAAILRTSAPIAATRAFFARKRLRRALARRVLVIEDEPMMAHSLAQTVRHMGHRLTGIAPTRREALAMAGLGAAPPDLIVADAQLRFGGDGVAIVRELLRARAVPVVLIVDAAEPAAALPGDSLTIAKPIAPGALEDAMRRLLEEPSRYTQ